MGLQIQLYINFSKTQGADRKIWKLLILKNQIWAKHVCLLDMYFATIFSTLEFSILFWKNGKCLLNLFFQLTRCYSRIKSALDNLRKYKNTLTIYDSDCYNIFFESKWDKNQVFFLWVDGWMDLKNLFQKSGNSKNCSENPDRW